MNLNWAKFSEFIWKKCKSLRCLKIMFLGIKKSIQKTASIFYLIVIKD